MAILARVYAIHALVARITIVILIAILVVNEFWIHMMVAIGGIGEGFVSRLGAQGLLVYFVKASQPLPVLRLLNHRMAGGLGVEVAWGGLCTC